LCSVSHEALARKSKRWLASGELARVSKQTAEGLFEIFTTQAGCNKLGA